MGMSHREGEGCTGRILETRAPTSHQSCREGAAPCSAPETSTELPLALPLPLILMQILILILILILSRPSLPPGSARRWLCSITSGIPQLPSFIIFNNFSFLYLFSVHIL